MKFFWKGFFLFFLLGGFCFQKVLAFPKIGIYIEPGHRTDHLDWTIAGNNSGTNPNILSELIWRNMKSRFLKSGFYVPFNTSFGSFFVDGNTTYAWAYSGENQDSDYNEDNRTDEFSRSINQTDGTTFFDYELSLNYKLPLNESKGLVLTPGFGYAMFKQNFNMRDGLQTVTGTNKFNGKSSPAVGATSPDLDSRYDTEWEGGFFSTALEMKPFKRHSIELKGSYFFHMVYYAKADWNLREDFQHPVSFIHSADNARGFIVDAKYQIGIGSGFSIYLKGKYQKFDSGSGVDITYLATGEKSSQKFNSANWDSFSLSLGLSWI